MWLDWLNPYPKSEVHFSHFLRLLMDATSGSMPVSKLNWIIEDYFSIFVLYGLLQKKMSQFKYVNELWKDLVPPSILKFFDNKTVKLRLYNTLEIDSICFTENETAFMSYFVELWEAQNGLMYHYRFKTTVQPRQGLPRFWQKPHSTLLHFIYFQLLYWKPYSVLRIHNYDF